MTFCVRLGAGAPVEKIGGKARSLLRLAEAGLPVPQAIVVTTDLLAKLRAGGPKLPSTLNAPGALTTVEFENLWGKARFGGKEYYGIGNQILYPMPFSEVKDSVANLVVQLSPPHD